MNSLIYIIGFITLILVITAIHEAGHYSVARFFKVTILDFSIGMGRSLKSWKDKAETEFHLRILPIGGFVKMKGEEEGDDANSKDSFACFALVPASAGTCSCIESSLSSCATCS